MPHELFFELDIEKRERIVTAGLKEFAELNYNEASTNNIVKSAGISKGSLFKYFSNKEDFYFYILDSVITDLLNNVNKDLSSLKGDIFEVILTYAEIEFSWHMNNPLKYQLLKKAFTDNQSSIYKKTVQRYKIEGDSLYVNIMNNINTEGLRWEKEKTINTIKWLMDGFNYWFIKENNTSEDIEKMKKLYINELKEYIEVIKEGLIIKKEEI